VPLNFQINESYVISGVWEIIPNVSTDHRGNIWTSFLKDVIEEILPDNLYFKHDKFSQSGENVLRGIHGDTKSWKFVTCVYGEIQQVVVDCRKNSLTKNKYQSYNISSSNPMAILIPPDMGNSYLVKSEVAVYHYKLAYEGEYIDAEKQFSFPWNSADFKIKWDVANPILSERDKGK